MVARRRVVGILNFLIVFFIGCTAAVLVYRPPSPPPPVYSARGLADIAASGEPIPRVVILHTAGFSATDPPAYYPHIPGPPALILEGARPPLPPKVRVRVMPGQPLRLTVDD